MKRLLVACLLGIGSLALALGAQSPGKIIDKYRTAIGGKAVKAVRATEWSGTAVAPDGRTGRFALRMSVPDRYRLDVELGAVAFTECYNGMSAWRRDAAGLRTLVGGDAAALRLRALLTAARLGDLSIFLLIFVSPIFLTLRNSWKRLWKIIITFGNGVKLSFILPSVAESKKVLVML